MTTTPPADLAAAREMISADAVKIRNYVEGPASGAGSSQELPGGTLKSLLKQQADHDATLALMTEAAGTAVTAAETAETLKVATEAARDEVLGAKDDVEVMVAGAANAALLSDDVPGSTGPDLALYGADGLKVASLAGNRDDIAALAAVAATIANDDVPGSSRGLKVISADGYLLSDDRTATTELGTTMGSLLDAASGLNVPVESLGAPAVIVCPKVLYLYGGIGQSLQVAGGLFADGDIYTPTALHDSVFMPSVGVRPNGLRWTQAVPAYEQLDSRNVNPVYETGMVRGAYALFDKVKAAAGYDLNIGVSNWALPGQPWVNLARGSDVWNWMLLDLQNWVDWGRANGYRILMAGMLQQHGHADTGTVSPELYATKIDRSVLQFNTDAKRILNQSQDVPWYLTQVGVATTSSLTQYGVAQGQLDLALKHGLVRLVGGDPQTDSIDGTHWDPLNYLWGRELAFLGVADDQFLGGLMPACVLDNWRTGEKTWRLKIGANYPLTIDTSGAVVVMENIAGLNGWEFDDGSGTNGLASMAVVGDGGATERGTAFLDITVTNTPSQYGDLRLGIGLKQGPGGGLTDGGSSFPCSIKANVSGGVVTGFTQTLLGSGWTTPPLMVISGAGSGAVGHTTLSGSTPVLHLDSGGSGYGGTSTYARLLRAGAGRVQGARHAVRWNRGAASSVGWDGLAAANTFNPRPLNDFLYRQLVRLKR